MHTVPELVAQASAVGLVTPREVRDGIVSLRDLSRSNHVHAILVRNHPVGYVKERGWASQIDGVDVINHERETLAQLRDLDLAPRLLTAQQGDTLWVGVVKGLDLDHQRGNVPELADVCRAWGVAVGTLHGVSTAGSSLTEAPRPWVLHPSHRSRSMQGVSAASSRAAVINAVENEPRLRAVADQVNERWTNRHWIHGDLTATNVVVETAPSLRVRFVDFEDAGLGDPSWDLATALDTMTRLAPQWRTPAAPLIEYFLRGYHHASGPGTLSPAVQAVRAVATAWQVAAEGDREDRPTCRDAEVKSWLERARSFAERSVAGLRTAA